MKKIPCNLLFHGSTRQFDMGRFESKAAAKRYVKSSDWQRPYTIVPIKEVAPPTTTKTE